MLSIAAAVAAAGGALFGCWPGCGGESPKCTTEAPRKTLLLEPDRSEAEVNSICRTGRWIAGTEDSEEVLMPYMRLNTVL
jgi:hypothetical protein